MKPTDDQLADELEERLKPRPPPSPMQHRIQQMTNEYQRFVRTERAEADRLQRQMEAARHAEAGPAGEPQAELAECEEQPKR